MTRFASMVLLAGVLGTATIGGRALAGDKCTIATSGDSQPTKACAKGGRPEAKKIMKKMVADAKAKVGNSSASAVTRMSTTTS